MEERHSTNSEKNESSAWSERLSSMIFDRITMPVVIVLLVLQLVASQTIWTLNATDQNSEELFALFVAVNLVSFSLISYVYRIERRKDSINRGLLLAGVSIILVLLAAALFD